MGKKSKNEVLFNLFCAVADLQGKGDPPWAAGEKKV